MGIRWDILSLDSFEANAPFLYPLKKSENLWFFYIFRGYINGKLARDGLISEVKR